VAHPARPLVGIGTAQLLGATVAVVPPLQHPHRLSRVDHVVTVPAKWIIVEVQFETPYAYQFSRKQGSMCTGR
jgi:hypothetical protein